MQENNSLGKLGEELAAGLLAAKGYELLYRNYVCPYGEIDLIVRQNKTISFVEVKTRMGQFLERPAEAVDFRKRRRMRNAARNFMARTNWLFDSVDFQVVEIFIEQTKEAEI